MQNQGKFSDPGATLVQGPQLPAPSSPRKFAKFNDLPPEVQGRIFEIAYRLTEDYGGQPDKWVFVSQKVREWIEPLIYESIVLPADFEMNCHRRLKLYEQTFRSRPKEFYSKSVKRAFTNNNLKYLSSDFELELLPVCDSLVSLECWSDPREELTNILKTKSWPGLKTLCINIDILPKDENTFHLPLFQNLTHLELNSEDPQLPSWESLKSLNKLTHMRVYMLVNTKSNQYRLAMDQVHAIATEARKCFPLNLKYFVILVPVDLLYYITSKERTTPEDKQRWERMENIRLGTFDPRIVLGCSGSWDDWFDGGELSDVEEEHIEKLVHYSRFVSLLTYPSWPRDHLDDEEKDTWAEVVRKDFVRKRFLASQKK